MDKAIGLSQTHVFSKDSNKSKNKESANTEEKKLRAACQEFESVFIQQMLKSMRKTVQRSDLIQQSAGRDVWESMLDEEYSKEMAKSGKFGLGEVLFNEFRKSLNAVPPGLQFEKKQSISNEKPIEGEEKKSSL